MATSDFMNIQTATPHAVYQSSDKNAKVSVPTPHAMHAPDRQRR
jgi:hypothetical protein